MPDAGTTRQENPIVISPRCVVEPSHAGCSLPQLQMLGQHAALLVALVPSSISERNVVNCHCGSQAPCHSSHGAGRRYRV